MRQCRPLHCLCSEDQRRSPLFFMPNELLLLVSVAVPGRKPSQGRFETSNMESEMPKTTPVLSARATLERAAVAASAPGYVGLPRLCLPGSSLPAIHLSRRCIGGAVVRPDKCMSPPRCGRRA